VLWVQGVEQPVGSVGSLTISTNRPRDDFLFPILTGKGRVVAIDLQGAEIGGKFTVINETIVVVIDVFHQCNAILFR
jgi:hypothetical protein